MFGVVVILVVLVVVLPVSFMLLGAAVSALAGFTLTSEAEATHEGSELIGLNT